MAIHLSEMGLEYEREFRFSPPRRWRLDFWLKEHALAIEIEGGSWVQGRHSRGKGFEADCEKYNALTQSGGRLLRFTPSMVEQGIAKTVIAAVLNG
jgi:very-short-patch-repair endonuclease